MSSDGLQRVLRAYGRGRDEDYSSSNRAIVTSQPSAYQGPIFANGLGKILPRLKTEIIKRSDQAKGFVQLPKRWIVERTIALLNRCRRLATDWENLNRNTPRYRKPASQSRLLRNFVNP